MVLGCKTLEHLASLAGQAIRDFQVTPAKGLQAIQGNRVIAVSQVIAAFPATRALPVTQALASQVTLEAA